MTTHLDWDRLGRYVRAARGPRAQAEIAANGGPSDETISKIEQGRWRPTRSVQKTLEKLESGLDWAPGSANAILSGGEPTELHPAPTHSPAPTPAVELDRGVMEDLINTVGRTRESPAIDRATEIFRVIAASVNITRNTLVHETGPASRDSAINSIYAATNAIPYMRDALEEIRGEQHDVEASPQPDASPEAHQDEEVTQGVLDLAARRVESEDKP
ncbi:helix-turn-helix domain-containing protein [Mycolicibacterium fortuitum]|uniref:helix-turn-helix domain-containing protein n=1 Tax=Mycolicibacterium fortuitum TaxID=1766 RepID=UPI00096C8A9D|nr:helix-turn-helix domain-containing protein [Mycolicibacterium fortuitum]OMC08579.1 hypothetical protein A5734_01990 [Mycolicibacterium fortuitum]